MAESKRGAGAESSSVRHSRWEAAAILWRYARGHWRSAAIGLVGTLFVVTTRLLLPWPLRGVIEVSFPKDDSSPGLAETLPGDLDPLLVLCGTYLALAIATGLSEFVQRVWLTRFVSLTVHDLRSAAMAAVRVRAHSVHPADLIARVVGDSARLKTNLIGTLIHLTQNGLLIVGVTAVFLYIAPALGVLFLAAGLLAVLLGYSAVEEVTETSRRQRETESRIAKHVHREAMAPSTGLNEDKLNRRSTRKQVRTTQLLGRTTLLIHAAVACTISLALWIGVQDVRSGATEPGELFLFIAYALTLHRRAVRVGRQVARIGKVVANTQRLNELIEPPDGGEPQPGSSAPAEIRLEHVRLSTDASRRRKRRLGPLDLSLARGAPVAVLGASGDGKSSLLNVLAGNVGVNRGRILWDGVDLAQTPERLRAAVGFVAQDARVPLGRMRELLGLESPTGSAPSLEQQELLKALGVSRLAAGLKQGLDTVVDEDLLAPGERRSLALAALALGTDPVWVIDTPIESNRRRDRARLQTLLERATNRIVVVALPGPWLLERFSQVIVLRKGKLIFGGSPQEWKQWKRSKQAERAPAPETS